MSSILAATSSSMTGITWLYVFIVRLMEEWPKISMTSLGWTPWASSRVAAATRHLKSA